MNVRIIGSNNAFSKYIKNNYLVYLIVLSIFLVGIILGTIYFRSSADEKNISEYIQNSIIKLSNQENIDTSQTFKKSMIKNIGTAILFWILGASVIGVPLLFLYIGYKGFTLGFTISTFITTFGFVKGNLMSFIMLFFQNVFLLFAMIISLTSGVKLALNLLFGKKEIKYELIRHTSICMLCIVLFIFSSGIEIVLNGPFLRYFLNNVK